MFRFVLLGACVAAGAASQSLAGFGGVIVALTLGALVFGDVATVLPLVVPLTLITTGTIVARHHARVEWRVLLRLILPVMAVGAIGGFALLESGIDPNKLMLSYGVLVAAVSTRALWREWRQWSDVAPASVHPASDEPAPDDSRPEKPPRGEPLPNPSRGYLHAAPWVLAAGFAQGLFASGGPLLVMAANRLGFDKGSFRATLCCVWLALNPIIVFGYVKTGRLTADMVPTLLGLAPAIGVGILIGEYGHDRVSNRAFRLVVNTVLLGSGVAILLR